MSLLKSIFGFKKTETKKEKVRSSELPQWFDKATASTFQDARVQTKETFHDILQEQKELKKKIDELEKAKLGNENIPAKEMHFMEGNRAAYIKRISDFIERTNVPDELEPDAVRDYIVSYQQELANFTKNSFRAFQITSQFFGDHLEEIGKHLKSLDDSFVKLNGIVNDKKIVSIAEIKSKIEALIHMDVRRESLMEEIESEEANYENLKTEKSDYELRIVKQKKNPAFTEMNHLNEAIRSVETELKILNSDFIDSFMRIEKALKKFGRDEDKLILAYLDNPVDAVLKDPELKILAVLQQVRTALENNQLEIEEKKKDKLLENISEINKEHLISFVVKHNDLELQKNDLARRIKQNTSMNEMNDLVYRLDHVKDKQMASAEKIKRMHQQLEDLDFSLVKSEIESGLRELGHNVEIVI